MEQNLLFTPEQAAKAALAALRYLSVLPRTVRQDYSDEFIAGRGQTINVKKEVVASKAKVYTEANRENRDEIEFGNVTQEWVPVKMTDQLYHAVPLPDNWATFSLQDFSREVLIPQAKAVVDELPVPLVNKMKTIKAPSTSGGADVSYGAGSALKFYSDGSNAFDVLAKLKKRLNDNKAPLRGRYLAVGSSVEAALLNIEQLRKVNEAGTDETLREAEIGRLYGFQIITAYDLPDDMAIAYTQDAFAHVTRVKRAPGGAPFSQTVAQDGFALRHILQYASSHLEDQSVLDTFYASEILEPKLAVTAGIGEPPVAP